MSVVRYLHCDHCNAEREPLKCVGWLSLMPTTDMGFDSGFDLDEQTKHFCSLGCLSSWALNRHLVAPC